MQTGNVLVIGNSGVGKSTLINAVLGIEKAKTGYGISGTTNELEIYESDSVPFRVIDTIGFEPTFFKEQKAINAVKNGLKGSAKEGQEEKADKCYLVLRGWYFSKAFSESNPKSFACHIHLEKCACDCCDHKIVFSS